MVGKIKTLAGILALTGACALGEQTNSFSNIAKVNLYYLYQVAVKAPCVSYETAFNATTNFVGSVSFRASSSCEALFKKGKDFGEFCVDKAHDALTTPWNVSVRKFGSNEREATEVSVYYCTEF